MSELNFEENNILLVLCNDEIFKKNGLKILLYLYFYIFYIFYILIVLKEIKKKCLNFLFIYVKLLIDLIK